MFVLKTKYTNHNVYSNDISTLADILIGLTNDEVETARLVTVAGNMKLGDGFATDGILLVCEKDEVAHS